MNCCFVLTFVVRWCPPFIRTVLQYYSTTVLKCSSVVHVCSSILDKKWITGTSTRGTHPRALEGREQRSYEDTDLLRSAFRSKLTAPEPRIARAPELVYVYAVRSTRKVFCRTLFAGGHPKFYGSQVSFCCFKASINNLDNLIWLQPSTRDSNLSSIHLFLLMSSNPRALYHTTKLRANVSLEKIICPIRSTICAPINVLSPRLRSVVNNRVRKFEQWRYNIFIKDTLKIANQLFAF